MIRISTKDSSVYIVFISGGRYIEKVSNFSIFPIQEQVSILFFKYRQLRYLSRDKIIINYIITPTGKQCICMVNGSKQELTRGNGRFTRTY